jgi:hypothetical protein
MKRLLFSFALVSFATVGFGQIADRDALVTPNGTVYTVEAPSTSQAIAIDATRMLVLTVQNGNNVTHLYVPGSTSTGFHVGGALAYDSDSNTLFIIWTHTSTSLDSSELLVTSYHEGTWTPAISIDNERYRLRSNLRLGITRRVSSLRADGSFADAPALLLHAVWWEESGKGEGARYALLTIDKGALSSIETHSLEEFVAPDDNVYNAVDPTFNKEILRHPAIVSSPMQDSVDVIFGDTHSNAIHGATLRPIADHRIHIPVGIGGGSGGGKPLNLAAPPTFSADWKGPITVIERADRLVFANAGETSLNYIMYANGAWSSVKAIAIDSHFPAEAALAALDRMVSTQ